MEKRLLIAIVLSFLVLFLYQALFVKKPPVVESPQEIAAQVEQTPEKELPLSQESPSAPAPLKEKTFQPVSETAEEQIVIETSLYRAVWSNKGARLLSWKLKQHKDEQHEDLELVSTQSETIQVYPFSLQSDDTAYDSAVNSALYTFTPLTLNLEDMQRGELRFQYSDDLGTHVEKVFTFEGGKYSFDIQVEAWKNGQKIDPRILWGPSLGNPSPQEQKQRFGGSQGIAVYSLNKVLRQDEKKFDSLKSAFNFIDWAAYENNYFTALFLAIPQKTNAAFIKEEKDQAPFFFLSLNAPQRAYIGPKDFDALSEFGQKSNKIIKFGFFGFIAEVLLRAIKAIHQLVPNWGFSIIILTFIIKVLFFPLTYSSTRSMAKMQELQPKIKALRAKYKKAKQDIGQRRKMNEEIMRLYKEHGVNPAGGCLPMLIQIPVFWGFFRLLVISIEFRHSPFILWIKDLSLKDPFYITPVLMGITQFISQKMTPSSADPTQQRMMLIMPVVMTIFFMNFQSGLVLYWLTNNLLQIGQQYIMNRFMHKKKKESHGKRRQK